MIENKNIPKHWQVKKLGAVCKLRNGYAFKSSLYNEAGVPVIRISDINGGIVSGCRAVRVKPIDEYENYLVENNDILVAMSGATTGKFGIYKSNEKAYQNQRVGKFKILDSKVLDNCFLFHQINSLKRQIEKDAYGGAQPNISSNKIEQMQIVVPPLPEQRDIVSKIEDLFSDLDNGKQLLLTAQQQLKVYRQSLLKAAFEGKLTAGWQEAQKLKENGVLAMAAEPEVKYENNGELPRGWKLSYLGEVIDKIEAGKSFKCDERPPKSDEIGVLKVSAVTWQVFDGNESKTVLNIERIISNYFVRENDFLFSRANTLDLVGAVVLVKSIDKKLMLSDKTLRFVFKSGISKKYILYYLRSRKGRKEIQRLSTGNQESMRNIGQERIKQIEFPMCSIEEQHLIVDELESKLTVCDKIEETIAQSLQQAESLRQSILKKAFEGKLV